jgi:hypothetical protein
MSGSSEIFASRRSFKRFSNSRRYVVGRDGSLCGFRLFLKVLFMPNRSIYHYILAYSDATGCRASIRMAMLGSPSR